jgi:hypothetical protein
VLVKFGLRANVQSLGAHDALSLSVKKRRVLCVPILKEKQQLGSMKNGSVEGYQGTAQATAHLSAEMMLSPHPGSSSRLRHYSTHSYNAITGNNMKTGGNRSCCLAEDQLSQKAMMRNNAKR